MRKRSSTGNLQVHNKSPKLKAELRKRILDEVGGPVIETHSGPGTMRRLVYADVEWLGIDTDPMAPNAIHADSRLVLRAIDLQRFRLFDIDPFGSPWEHVWLVSQHRPLKRDERVGLVMTAGTSGGHSARCPVVQGWSRQMGEAIGLRREVPNKWLANRGAEPFAQALVSAWFSSCALERWWTTLSKGGKVYYFGCVLRGK